MTCPEMAVPNAFIGGSFWNNSAFPSSTDPHPHPRISTIQWLFAGAIVQPG